MRTIRRMVKTPFFIKFICLSGFRIVLLLCIFALSTLAKAKRTRAAQIERLTAYESVYISSGDSLWSIAQQYRGNQDTAVFVENLKMLNGLSSDHIQEGYYILVPVTTTL